MGVLVSDTIAGNLTDYFTELQTQRYLLTAAEFFEDSILGGILHTKCSLYLSLEDRKREDITFSGRSGE